ncbi:MAG: hypothetical protein AAGI11_06340 [Pseudomonadota bacterium]
MIERIPAYISLSTAALLILSVTYDLGFYGYFELSFRQLPTTVSDHMRSALLWLPGIVILGFILATLEMITRAIEGGRSEEEIIDQSKNPKRTRLMRDLPYLFMMAIPILAVPLMIAGVIPFSWDTLAMAALVVWLVIWFLIFRVEKIRQRTPLWFVITMIVAPLALSYMAWRGYADAEKTKSEEDYLFTVNGQQITGNLVRVVGAYHLIWIPETNRVEFIQSATISSFGQIKEGSNADETTDLIEEKSKGS